MRRESLIPVRHTRRGPAALWILGVLVGWPTSAMAQATAVDSSLVAAGDSTALPSLDPRIRLLYDPSTLTVGVALKIPGGSSADPVGQEGQAAVTAATLGRVLADDLRSLAASAEVSYTRGEFTIAGRAAPGAVVPLIEAMGRAAFERPLPLIELEQTRTAHLSRLRFEVGAPVRAFQSHMASVVFRGFDGWGRPPRGVPPSVEAIDLERLAEDPPFGPEQRRNAKVALVGNVDPQMTETQLQALLGPPPDTPETRPTGMTWSDGARDEVAVEITSTWVAIALPLDGGLPLWKVELLAHHIGEVLEPDPPRPGLVSPEVDIVYPGGRPAILVTFAISPERSHQWVERVLSTARLETDAPPDERFFRWQRRRFRTVWLSNQALPEARATRLAAGWESQTPDDMEIPFDIEVWRTDLEDAAGGLGPPRILIYGPDLSDQEVQDFRGLERPQPLDPRVPTR